MAPGSVDGRNGAQNDDSALAVSTEIWARTFPPSHLGADIPDFGNLRAQKTVRDGPRPVARRRKQTTRSDARLQHPKCCLTRRLPDPRCRRGDAAEEGGGPKAMCSGDGRFGDLCGLVVAPRGPEPVVQVE